jgi:hypothetical protein
MADGFDIHISAEHAAKLRALADRADMSPEDYAALLIDREMEEAARPAIDPDPAIDHAIAEEAIRNGDTIPWTEFRGRLRRLSGRDG